MVVSLGFDTYREDPLGDLALTTDGYLEIGRRVGSLGRRLVVLQAGDARLVAEGCKTFVRIGD